MSVLDGIREARDSLVKYLSLVGGSGSLPEKTENERGAQDKTGSTLDLVNQAVKIISDVPEELWSKQVNGIVEADKKTTAQVFATGDLTESSGTAQEGVEPMEIDRTVPIDNENEQTSKHISETQIASVSEVSSTASMPPFPRAATFANTFATDFAGQASRSAPVRSSSMNSILSSVSNDKLSLEGFSEVKKLLEPHQSSGSSRGRKRPYMSLGDLGINEGWTTILTNAAYCFDNTPAEGWRREVAIRMSGKSKGSTDIHYVTPDKRKRFRSRQELSLYLSRTNSSSMSFLNSFEFRAAFCLCHEPEDNSRSYLECSYGLAGCNRWLHAECLGLGSRSEQELALMPKVICPYCAAYLKGTGELESFVTPDMHVMDRLPELPREEDDDAIEESAEPHLLWGLQGSPFVYCSASNASGLDAPPASEDEDFLEEPAASSEMASPQRGPGHSDNQPEEIEKIMQHRLFQAWMPTPSSETEQDSSALPAASPVRRAPRALEPPTPMEVVVLSEDDEGVPSNARDLEPGERVRRARHPDGSTSMVRVHGGWMRKRASEEEPGLTIPSDHVPAPEVEDMKRRILAKAAAKKAAAPDDGVTSVLARRYKNELIEAAVVGAKSSSHRPKHSFDVQRLASARVASVEPLPVHVLAELRDAYHSKPCLSYLPLEDGGLRFGTASYANVPRSLHAFCIANLMCGVCLNSTDDDLIAIDGSGESAYTSSIPESAENGKTKPKKSKKASFGSKVNFVDPSFDRYNLVPLSCGAVTYSAHKQCAQEGQRPVLDASDSDAARYIKLGAAHEYEQVDDADCDLCGRKGGLLRHFSLAAVSSSIAPPNEEGWLAHVPCLNFLHHSGLLRPLSTSKSGVFEANFFSHRVGWTAALPSDAVTEVEQDARETDPDAVDAGLLVSPSRGNTPVAAAGRSEGDDKAEGPRSALLEDDRPHGRAPLSRFDQLHGQWRCTLCGLQTGLALRCTAAGCCTRAHPLCVQACGDPDWRLCSASTHDGGECQRSSLVVLCSLHSSPLQ